MKNLILWFVTMLITVLLCVFVENGFTFEIAEKSDNLSAYWLIGAFVYPLIRKLKGSSEVSDDTSIQKVENEKEKRRLQREKDALDLKLQQEEQQLKHQKNHDLVSEALKKSKLSEQTFHIEAQRIIAGIGSVETELDNISNTFDDIKNRNKELLAIIGYKEWVSKNRKKLKSINSAIMKTNSTLTEE